MKRKAAVLTAVAGLVLMVLVTRERASEPRPPSAKTVACLHHFVESEASRVEREQASVLDRKSVV